MVKKFCVLCLFVVLLLTLMACGSGSRDTDPNLIGAWVNSSGDTRMVYFDDGTGRIFRPAPASFSNSYDPSVFSTFNWYTRDGQLVRYDIDREWPPTSYKITGDNKITTPSNPNLASIHWQRVG